MPKGKHRIPRKNSDFFNYINRTADHLTKSASAGGGENWQRIGLTEETKSAWMNFRSRFAEKYRLTTDRTKRTSTLIEERDQVKREFISFAEGPLKQIGANANLAQEDRDIFNLPARDRTLTPRPPVVEAPVTHLQVQQGSGIKFTHRRHSDANRASMHPDADVAETRWVLLEKDAPAPASPEACPHIEFSSKAIHIMWLGIENAGKRLHCFSRWRNTRAVEKSGPFGKRMTVLLSD